MILSQFEQRVLSTCLFFQDMDSSYASLAFVLISADLAMKVSEASFAILKAFWLIGLRVEPTDAQFLELFHKKVWCKLVVHYNRGRDACSVSGCTEKYTLSKDKLYFCESHRAHYICHDNRHGSDDCRYLVIHDVHDDSPFEHATAYRNYFNAIVSKYVCGWEDMMESIFKYDSNGRDHWGFTREGYGIDGFNRLGHDKDGYYRNGLTRDGFNRDGFNSNGMDRYGFDICLRDIDDHDSNGYGRDGYHYDGHHRNGYNNDGFDVNGFDVNGFDAEGKHFRDNRWYQFKSYKYKLAGRLYCFRRGCRPGNLKLRFYALRYWIRMKIDSYRDSRT